MPSVSCRFDGGWSCDLSRAEAHARASGRRHYHAVRRHKALLRRQRVMALAIEFGVLRRGLKAFLARRLHISERTAGRDLRALGLPG